MVEIIDLSERKWLRGLFLGPDNRFRWPVPADRCDLVEAAIGEERHFRLLVDGAPVSFDGIVIELPPGEGERMALIEVTSIPL